MAFSKTQEFTSELQELSALFKVLSHPARLQILIELAQKKECVCGEIVELLPLSQSTVSQHLKELKTAGLIKGEINGTSSCYCINWDKIEILEDSAKTLFNQLNALKINTKCC